MSTLTTTLINTANGTTNLTLSTGNTSGPTLVVTGGTDVLVRANSSANVFIVNSSAISANVPFAISNTLNVSNTLTAAVVNTNSITGNVVFSSNVVVPTINATSINLGAPSIAASGFSRLPNGLLIQWGTTASIATGGTVITFPTAFAANPYSVQFTPISAAATIRASTVSTTTVTAIASVASTAYYIAIGV